MRQVKLSGMQYFLHARAHSHRKTLLHCLRASFIKYYIIIFFFFREIDYKKIVVYFRVSNNYALPTARGVAKLFKCSRYNTTSTLILILLISTVASFALRRHNKSMLR